MKLFKRSATVPANSRTERKSGDLRREIDDLNREIALLDRDQENPRQADRQVIRPRYAIERAPLTFRLRTPP